jgi:hypothetical protein
VPTLLIQGHGLSLVPTGTTTPTYSLKYARSGSPNSSASIAPLHGPTSPLAPALFSQTRAVFHHVSRAGNHRLRAKVGNMSTVYLSVNRHQALQLLIPVLHDDDLRRRAGGGVRLATADDQEPAIGGDIVRPRPTHN